MSPDSECAGSGRQPLSPPTTAGLHNGPPATAAHSLPETVSPRPAANVRLVRPLHSRSSLRQANPLLPVRMQWVVLRRRLPGHRCRGTRQGRPAEEGTARPLHATARPHAPQPWSSPTPGEHNARATRAAIPAPSHNMPKESVNAYENPAIVVSLPLRRNTDAARLPDTTNAADPSDSRAAGPPFADAADESRHGGRPTRTETSP